MIETPRRWRGMALAAAFFTYLLIGTWPYNWHDPLPPNAAARQADGSISFPAPGVAKTTSSWLAEAVRAGKFRAELCARTLSAAQTGPGRILTFSRDPYSLNFTLGQERGDLVVRLRTRDGDSGELDRRIAGVFAERVWRTIRMDVEPGKLRVAVDGVVRLEESLTGNPMAHFDPGFGVLIGNEMSGNRAWLGDVRCASAGAPGREVDLLRNAVIPWRVERLARPPQVIPFRDRLDAGDVVVNLLGFVPLGMLVGLLLRPRWWGSWVLAWIPMALLSAAIEIAQFTLPSRFPSVNDLLLNCAGAVLGLIIAKRRSRSKVSTRSSDNLTTGRDH